MFGHVACGSLDQSKGFVIQHLGDASAPVPTWNANACRVALEQRTKARIEFSPRFGNARPHGIDERRVGERADMDSFGVDRHACMLCVGVSWVRRSYERCRLGTPRPS